MKFSSDILFYLKYSEAILLLDMSGSNRNVFSFSA